MFSLAAYCQGWKWLKTQNQTNAACVPSLICKIKQHVLSFFIFNNICDWHSTWKNDEKWVFDLVDLFLKYCFTCKPSKPFFAPGIWFKLVFNASPGPGGGRAAPKIARQAHAGRGSYRCTQDSEGVVKFGQFHNFITHMLHVWYIYLPGGFKHVLFSIIWIILPSDELIFFKMVEATNQLHLGDFFGKCW